MNQVLGNLVSNAVKFTERGEISIHARCERVGNNMRLDVRVTDTGEGIPPEEIDRIFDSFHQARAESIDRKPQGTGLGLTISRRLVELMGGVMTVRSAPGRGIGIPFRSSLHLGGRKQGIRRRRQCGARIAKLWSHACACGRGHEDQPDWSSRKCWDR